jgi:hypothetical protein
VSFPVLDAERGWHEEASSAATQNLSCAWYGVSPESCVSLGEMPFETSLGICRVRPNLVSHVLRHVFIHPMLIPVYSPRLSSNPF